MLALMSTGKQLALDNVKYRCKITEVSCCSIREHPGTQIALFIFIDCLLRRHLYIFTAFALCGGNGNINELGMNGFKSGNEMCWYEVFDSCAYRGVNDWGDNTLNKLSFLICCLVGVAVVEQQNPSRVPPSGVTPEDQCVHRGQIFPHTGKF